jgi:hypothetical protein
MATQGATHTYATELAGLWTGLSRALSDLEALAARPEQRLGDDDASETLSRLRYSLHAASELTLGIEPPEGAKRPHAELAYALARARDATAAVASLLERGGVDAIQPVVHEWRGTLFAVRMARTRAAQPAVELAAREARTTLPPPQKALAAILLIVVGAATFAGGTMLHRWPVWGAGLVLLTVGCALSAQRR